jgi:hypothetical protein
VYGLDTGFVCYYRGWDRLRPGDLGVLWEHFVLNEMLAALQGEKMQYWRDKAGHEVDFVLKRRGQPPLAIECKWSADGFSAGNLKAFRNRHPEGNNVAVCQDVERTFVREVDGVPVVFESLSGLVLRLTAGQSKPRRPLAKPARRTKT